MFETAKRRVMTAVITAVLGISLAVGCGTTGFDSLILSGPGNPRLDVTGGVIDLDGDNDTSITADTDDQIDIEIAGADDFAFKANLFELVSGSVVDLNGSADALVLDADGDTSLASDTDDQIDIEIAGADDFVITANLFELQTGSVLDINGAVDGLVLDADGDTSLAADTDDQIDFEIGGADEVTLTAATLDLNNTYVDQDIGTENIGGFPTIATSTITYTQSGAVFTVADGEIWIIHDVVVNVTTNFDCSGDDCTLTIGDGNDPDGFIVLADAEMQAADTEFTGAQAGWQGLSAATRGVYLDEVTTNSAHRFVYAPSGAAETIDAVVAGNTPAGGAATIYLIYTRLQ